jgi:hypothetical protein
VGGVELVVVTVVSILIEVVVAGLQGYLQMLMNRGTERASGELTMPLDLAYKRHDSCMSHERHDSCMSYKRHHSCMSHKRHGLLYD